MTAQTQAIGLSNRDDYFTPSTPSKPARSNAPSQYAIFVDEQIRAGSVPPDLRLLKARALAWLRHEEPESDEAWLESKACGLVSFTRAFLQSYEGFTTGAAAPF
jgi:hypothetical protein